MMEKYDGLKYAFRSETSLQNARATCKEKYGEEYPLQCDEIRKKNQYLRKEFTFPSGTVHLVQGYEPECLTELLKTHDEAEIVPSPKLSPIITYTKIDFIDGFETEQRSNYYPDILVGKDKLVEVKSDYFYELDKINNERKFRASLDFGYEIECWIYDRNKQLLQIIHHYMDKNGNKIRTVKQDSRGQNISRLIGNGSGFDEMKAKILSRSGHVLLDVSPDSKKAKYICGSCGKECELLLETLSRTTTSKKCANCNRVVRTKTIEEAQRQLNEANRNLEILTYTNAQSVTVKCDQGHIYTSKFDHLLNRKCPKC